MSNPERVAIAFLDAAPPQFESSSYVGWVADPAQTGLLADGVNKMLVAG